MTEESKPLQITDFQVICGLYTHSCSVALIKCKKNGL